MPTIPYWLQLLRPANVATALADVFAGYAVSGAPPTGQLAWLLASTACLYAGGIVLNDVFDRHLDALERPERPIPSGKIAASSAAALGTALLATGVALAAVAGRQPGTVALGIAVAVLTYNAWAKRVPFIGPTNMGLCRGLNLLLGVAAVPAALESSWPLALLPLVYISAVTLVSRGEVHGAGRQLVATALLMVTLVVASVAGLSQRLGAAQLLTLALAGLLAWRVLPPFWRAARTPTPAVLRAAVRAGVLSLVLLDAGIAAAYAGMIYVLAILLTGLVAGRLARTFAVT